MNVTRSELTFGIVCNVRALRVCCAYYTTVNIIGGITIRISSR